MSAAADQDQDQPGHLEHVGAGDKPIDFAGIFAPPLEGEAVCVCGQPEGLHRSDGACDVSRCLHFVAEDECEEGTAPDHQVPAELRAPGADEIDPPEAR